MLYLATFMLDLMDEIFEMILQIVTRVFQFVDPALAIFARAFELVERDS